MRVQEKASASCAKMTEERSMNGDVPSGSKRGFGLGNADGPQSPNLTATTEPERSCSIAGGRLKFFKDGKFILELSHRKEGDRTSWVPVPKKTYWPPPGAAGTPRQESSTSLSVSDDNSSVQSSPWQRDHCWKQSNPRHNIGKEMTFIMKPLQHVLYIRNLHLFSHTIRRKRRCPYDPSEVNAIDININNMNNGKIVRVKRNVTDSGKLPVIVQTLWERVQRLNSGESVAGSSSGANNTSVLAQNHARTMIVPTSRMDPSIISPRKRILREMERVSLEDLVNSKRQRARTTSALPHNNNNGSSSYCTVTCQTLQPASALPSPPQTGAKSNVSNYSITSLLGPSREEEATTAGAGTQDGEPSFLRTLLKSPSQQTTSPEPSPRPKGSNKTGGTRKSSPVQHRPIRSPSHQGSPTLSPSPDSLRSGLRTPVVPSMGNVSHAPHLSPYLATPYLYPPLTSPYLPHHASHLHHPYYSSLHPLPSPYRSSSPISPFWVNYPPSSLPPRGALYPGLVPPCPPTPLSPCPWPMTHEPLDDIKKEEGVSDVPLNLSKHAG